MAVEYRNEAPKSRFVPKCESDLSQIDELCRFLRDRRVAVLTGAGCSTASGIPDYRGPETGKTERNPIMYGAFVGRQSSRRRYWARSAIGWPRIRQAAPNRAHRALTALESRGLVSGVITQNVDRLHAKAGTESIVELHGALAEVICLACGHIVERDDVQQRIDDLNPGWIDEHGGALAPDGDVVLPTQVPEDFRVPVCTECGGILKPNVVFFGENVATSVVQRAWDTLWAAQALMVLGSSLKVYSGYRFVRGADREGLPVVIINLGNTRGDEHAGMCIHAEVGEALSMLCDRL